MGTAHELKQIAPVIEAIVAAVHQPELREQVEPILKMLQEQGGENLANAIRQIFDGERDEEKLCEKLGQESFFITAILQALA